MCYHHLTLRDLTKDYNKNMVNILNISNILNVPKMGTLEKKK